MFESLCSILCKIGSILKFSSNRIDSPNPEIRIITNTGTTAATFGADSPVHIGDIHHHFSKPEIDPELRFKNRLIAVANELPLNFRNVGNVQNPFITIALKTLVYDEPFIHQHPELLQKAQKCLSTALILSTSSNPKLRPSDGQYLMKDLAQFLSDNYRIKIINPE